MPKTRIGLDVGSTAVRAAELVDGSPPTVIRAAQVPLPVGAVENGEVRDVEAVSQALRKLWSSSHGGFKSRKVWMGVGNQRVVVREIALPTMPEKELRQSLGFQVQEFIPMPVDDAVLDYHLIEEIEVEGRQMLRLLLVAAQKAMVDTLIAAATGAKLEPVGVDLVPFALVRAVGATGAGMELEASGGEAVVDVGAHVTNIVVHAAGETRFVRILPSGGRDITVAIARGMSVEDDFAERLKRGDVGADAEPTPEEAKEIARQLAQASEIAMQRATQFVDEIRSSLEFYTAQTQGARIERLLISGGGSKLDGFIDILRQRIPVTVEPGRVFSRVGSKLSLSEAAQAGAEPLLATAVGLGIPWSGS
ncbi:MAG: type IV pilus assembly protein PilM [Actinobacteria bacterium]|nr:type IV pilus assembly protein PilM [Actinomycetota bacterium]